MRMPLACSRFTDSGDGTKICAQEKQRRGGGPPSPSPYLPPFFFPPLSEFVLHSTVWTPGKGYGPKTKIVGVKDALLPLQTTSTAENKLNCVSQVCNKLAGEIALEIGVTTAILFCTCEWKMPTNRNKGWHFFFACVMSVKDLEANDLFFLSLTQQHLAGTFPGHFSKNQRLQVLNFSRQISSEYDELHPNDFERQAILQTLVVLWNDKEMITTIFVIIIIAIIIGSLGKDVYERCTSTGRHHCTFCN